MADDFSAIVLDAIASVPDDLKVRVTFTRSTPGTSDPSSGTTSGPSESTIVGTAVGVPGDLDQYDKLGLIHTSARTLVFVPDTAGELPQAGDSIVWVGEPWSVQSADPTQPGGVTLAARVVISR